jgi:hypothetical protein
MTLLRGLVPRGPKNYESEDKNDGFDWEGGAHDDGLVSIRVRHAGGQIHQGRISGSQLHQIAAETKENVEGKSEIGKSEIGKSEIGKSEIKEGGGVGGLEEGRMTSDLMTSDLMTSDRPKHAQECVLSQLSTWPLFDKSVFRIVLDMIKDPDELPTQVRTCGA